MGALEERKLSEFIERLRSLDGRLAPVLVLMVQGKKNREIADELGLAIHTVENYVSSIVTDLECRDRADLLLFMEEHVRVDDWYWTIPWGRFELEDGRLVPVAAEYWRLLGVRKELEGVTLAEMRTKVAGLTFRQR